MPLTLNGPANIGLQGNTVGFNGPISGSGSLALVGPGGTLLLGGSNSYTGGTTVPTGLPFAWAITMRWEPARYTLTAASFPPTARLPTRSASPLVLNAGTLGDPVNNGPLTFTAASAPSLKTPP